MDADVQTGWQAEPAPSVEKRDITVTSDVEPHMGFLTGYYPKLVNS